MMNRPLFALVVVCGLNGSAFASGSKVVQAPVEKVFVPLGFDDNDKVEVIVHGHFPNSCYKTGPASSTVDVVNKKILVTAQAYYYSGAACAEMIVPFIKTVELKDHIPSGNYKIEVVNNPASETATLSVARSTRPDADDYLYAGVHSATVEQKLTGEREIVLRGQHPLLLQGCIKFKEVKVSASSSNVIVVQPITRIELDQSQCRGSVDNHFEYRAPLSAEFDRGEYVMHVRVLDGNAINQFFDFE